MKPVKEEAEKDKGGGLALARPCAGVQSGKGVGPLVRDLDTPDLLIQKDTEIV
jgi:hypothetical protein